MMEVELLAFQDQFRNSLTSISGVAEALSHVGTESTDYCMCQMLANVHKPEGVGHFLPWDLAWIREPVVWPVAHPAPLNQRIAR